jgi:Flp pilus assembly protein TadG
MTRRGVAGQAARREAGSATVELALLAPGLLLLAGLIVLGGRVVLAGGSVEQVAAAAARQASLARDPATADRLARQQATRTLAAQRLQCTRLSVAVDTSGFGVPVGQPASVAVDVTCTVRLADLTLPGLPATGTLRSHAVSPLDPWRARAAGP